MDQHRGSVSTPTDPYRIAQMPSKELLEEFLRGMSGPVTVVFDTSKGAFERIASPSRPDDWPSIAERDALPEQRQAS
jgi:hypothetical protein